MTICGCCGRKANGPIYKSWVWGPDIILCDPCRNIWRDGGPTDLVELAKLSLSEHPTPDPYVYEI